MTTSYTLCLSNLILNKTKYHSQHGQMDRHVGPVSSRHPQLELNLALTTVRWNHELPLQLLPLRSSLSFTKSSWKSHLPPFPDSLTLGSSPCFSPALPGWRFSSWTMHHTAIFFLASHFGSCWCVGLSYFSVPLDRPGASTHRMQQNCQMQAQMDQNEKVRKRGKEKVWGEESKQIPETQRSELQPPRTNIFATVCWLCLVQEERC